MELYFITGNPNKFMEAKLLIPGLIQLPIDLPEIQEINPEKIIAAKLEQARARCFPGISVNKLCKIGKNESGIKN